MVGMMDEIVERPASVERRHVQRLQRQHVRFQCRRDIPPDNRAGEYVDDERDVREPCPGCDIGDVRDP